MRHSILAFLVAFTTSLLLQVWWKPSWVRRPDQVRFLARVQDPMDEQALERWRQTVTELVQGKFPEGTPDDVEENDILDGVLLFGSVDLWKALKWSLVFGGIGVVLFLCSSTLWKKLFQKSPQ